MRILLLIFLLLLPLTARADEAADLLAENQLLTAELQLARSGKLYVIFDLHDLVIQLKASGVILRSLPMLDVQHYGSKAELKAHRLERRVTSSPPRREEVQVVDKNDEPAAKTDPDPDLKALELADMPGSYRLFLEDGTRISVHATGEGLVAAVNRVGHKISDVSARGRHAILGLISNKSYGEVRLTLSPADARQLYWSFAEQSACLIRFPATVN